MYNNKALCPDFFIVAENLIMAIGYFLTKLISYLPNLFLKSYVYMYLFLQHPLVSKQLYIHANLLILMLTTVQI